nr:MAG TPA_asm: hypothetical protein [Caudoviricetes sp.]
MRGLPRDKMENRRGSPDFRRPGRPARRRRKGRRKT